MRDRLSEWQLQLAESAGMPGVEAFLEQITAVDSSTRRDQDASFFACREDQPHCGYDLAETANRRRAILQEFHLSYAKIKRGMQFAASMNVSFEQAKGFMSDRSLTWVLQVAPVLVLRKVISADVSYQLSIAIIGVNLTRAEMDKLTAGMIRRVGFFKGQLPENDDQLLTKYRERFRCTYSQ